MNLKDFPDLFLCVNEGENFPKIKIDNTENLFLSFNNIYDKYHTKYKNNKFFKKDFEKIFNFSSVIHLNKIILYPSNVYIFDDDFNVVWNSRDVRMEENYIFNEDHKNIYKKLINENFNEIYFLEKFNELVKVNVNEEEMFYFNLKYDIDFFK